MIDPAAPEGDSEEFRFFRDRDQFTSQPETSWRGAAGGNNAGFSDIVIELVFDRIIQTDIEHTLKRPRVPMK